MKLSPSQLAKRVAQFLTPTDWARMNGFEKKADFLVTACGVAGAGFAGASIVLLGAHVVPVTMMVCSGAQLFAGAKMAGQIPGRTERAERKAGRRPIPPSPKFA